MKSSLKVYSLFPRKKIHPGIQQFPKSSTNYSPNAKDSHSYYLVQGLTNGGYNHLTGCITHDYFFCCSSCLRHGFRASLIAWASGLLSQARFSDSKTTTLSSVHITMEKIYVRWLPVQKWKNREPDRMNGTRQSELVVWPPKYQKFGLLLHGKMHWTNNWWFVVNLGTLAINQWLKQAR